MFSTRSHVYKPDYDQAMASHEDLDRSPGQWLARYETSENGDVDVAMLNSPLVTQSLESDTDSLSTDSQVTARPQFHNDSSTTKRARRTPDTTQAQPNSTAVNTQSRNKSPVQTENSETMDHANPGCHYVRSFEALTSKYGENTDHDLKPAQVIEVIKAGDTFLREDCVDFITSYLEDCRDGLWNTPVPCPPLNGSLTENLFKSFHCAEILDQRIAVDPIRLRVMRILLFRYYEQLCKESYSNPELLSRRSRGRDTASIATDILVEEIFHGQKGQRDPQVWKRRRTSLQKQKQIGKRWSTLISCIGPGFLLICSPDLATHM